MFCDSYWTYKLQKEKQTMNVLKGNKVILYHLESGQIKGYLK